MKRRTFGVCVVVVTLFIASGCASLPFSHPLARDLPWFEYSFPLGSKLMAPVDGEVVRLPDAVDAQIKQPYVALRSATSYFYKGEEIDVEFTAVLINVSPKVSEGDFVIQGDEIGQSLGTMRFALIHSELEPWLVINSWFMPIYLFGNWWYSPSPVIDDFVDWFSYKRPESTEALVEYLSADHPDDEETSYDFGLTIWNNARWMMPVYLDAYPKAFNDKARSALQMALAATPHLKKMINAMQTFQAIDIEGHTVLLYWPKGFDSYLKKEYPRGTRLWIYGNAIYYEKKTDTIVFLVRDFSLDDKYTTVEMWISELRKMM